MITKVGRGTATSWTPELKQVNSGGTVTNTGWNALAGQSWYTYTRGTVTAVGMLRGPIDWGATFTSGTFWCMNYPSGLTPVTETDRRLIIGHADQTTYMNRGTSFFLQMWHPAQARNSSYPIRLQVYGIEYPRRRMTGDNASSYFPQFFGDYGSLFINMQYRSNA